MANIRIVDRPKRPSAVVSWYSPTSTKHYRMCLQCMLYLNAAFEPDASQYSRTWIKKYKALLDEEKCKHENVRREKKNVES